MSRIFAAMILLSVCAVPAPAEVVKANPDKVPSKQDFGELRREVETLRGKKFLHPVPVFQISTRELRAISDRDLDKQFPGVKLKGYTELLAWMDFVPPQTDLKAVYADLYADQVAGLYDPDAKEMCIPSLKISTTNAAKNTPGQKLEQVTPEMDDIVLAHEFTHALEDQYWPLNDPRDDDTGPSTDRSTAHSFVAEGSACREMIEAVPAQLGDESPGIYFFLWNLIHSKAGEFALDFALAHSWKSADALTEGVPEELSRSEVMPYSYGYLFCADIMRHWGLDGLDYIYDHPPISSQQVMHPEKCWEWREFPVQIDLPETLPGAWKQAGIDSLGEADLAVLFGCKFKNPGYGLKIARGWKGDHEALFQDATGHGLLLWASAWDSTNAAQDFAGVCVKERQNLHQASVTKNGPTHWTWERPDGRHGFLRRDGNRVILIETDDRAVLPSAEAIADTVIFTAPREEAIRAAANGPVRRFNPILARQTDGDYSVTRSLGGLLSRHDRNSVGAADVFLLGALGESRRTTSFNQWQVGDSLIAWHESEARRGVTRTTLLPWGLLWSHESARLPQTPDRTFARTSVAWGLLGSYESDGTAKTTHLLPFGLLLDRKAGPAESSFYILGTGSHHQPATKYRGSSARFRLLGIPVWTTHAASPRPS